MKRGLIGRYESVSLAGETVNAFLPDPLPPVPPIQLDGPIHQLLERALLAIGRLDSVSTLLPETGLFLYSYVRKEAVLSSQIEGTQSSLSDLLLFEMDQVPGVPVADAQEASNYVSAMDHGLSRLHGGFPLSARLICEIHEKLMQRGRGSDKHPGEFRRSQNWIGGTRPGNAVFVPPPHTFVAQCVSDLEKFTHAGSTELPLLVKSGIFHVQFETIHPFLDGNGRVGRLLITLYLCSSGLLREPLLYLSLYFKKNRARYYDLLEIVRKEGDWEAWIAFFLDGVAETAEGAAQTAKHLVDLFNTDRSRIQKHGRQTASLLKVHEALKQRPLSTLSDVATRSGLSFPSTASAMEALGAMGLVRELTGKKRNRVFTYDKYLAVLSEGTERNPNPLSRSRSEA